ncbi:hypothetical protein Hanom_Chr11g00972641 [Helianthus anomalus]
MPSSYPGRHMSLPILEPSTSKKRWVSVANWATQLVSFNLSSLLVSCKVTCILYSMSFYYFKEFGFIIKLGKLYS